MTPRSDVPNSRSRARVVSSCASGNRCPYVSMVSVIDRWPRRAWITRGWTFCAISPEAYVCRSAWKP